MKLDGLHCALLVAIVLLAVYAFGSFREAASGCTQDALCKSGFRCGSGKYKGCLSSYDLGALDVI